MICSISKFRIIQNWHFDDKNEYVHVQTQISIVSCCSRNKNDPRILGKKHILVLPSAIRRPLEEALVSFRRAGDKKKVAALKVVKSSVSANSSDLGTKTEVFSKSLVRYDKLV